MRKFILLAFIMFQTAFTIDGYCASEAGGGFTYDNISFQRSAKQAHLTGTLTSHSNVTYTTVNFTVSTFDHSDMQNGFSTFSISNFSAHQTRPFTMTFSLYEVTDVAKVVIAFGGGKQKV